MSYTINMPLANQSLGVTQPLVNRNFTIIDTTLNVDHYSVTDATANQGRHKRVSLVNQAPAPTTGAGRLALYSADVAGRSTLFYKKDGSATEIQLTGVNPTVAKPGFTFLPGGMLLQWGSAVYVAGATTTFSFLTPFDNTFEPTVSFAPVKAINSTNNEMAFLIDFTTSGATYTGFRSGRSGTGVLSLNWIAIGAKA